MECIEGLRRPDRGSISVLGLDPFKDVYKLQERIGVQLQEANCKKRIKVWEAVYWWVFRFTRRRRSTANGCWNSWGLGTRLEQPGTKQTTSQQVAITQGSDQFRETGPASQRSLSAR